MTSRVVSVAAAVALAVQAVVLGWMVVSARPVLLPVMVDIGGGMRLALVNLGIAAITLLTFSAVCRTIAIVWPSPVIRWIEWSQVSGITVFLIAQLNGVRDVAALVALYALAAGACLFLVLHEVGTVGRWPFSFGAVVGIVPWGVIAFYQIGAVVMGEGPVAIIRVITIATLAVTAAYWAVSIRRGPSRHASAILTVAAVSLFAWLTIGAILNPSWLA